MNLFPGESLPRRLLPAMGNWAWKVGSWRGVPIRIHASTPIGLYAFSGFRFIPEWWACTLALVLLHELGHALAVRLVGGKATEVMLTGFGGHCGWVGEVSPLGRAAIACGGVAAQLALLGLALTLAALSRSKSKLMPPPNCSVFS